MPTTVFDKTASNRQRATVTLHDLLTLHGLDELHLQDEATLKACLNLITDRITRNEASLHTNLRQELAALVRRDTRLYETIKNKIDTLLTGTFHVK